MDGLAPKWQVTGITAGCVVGFGVAVKTGHYALALFVTVFTRISNGTTVMARRGHAGEAAAKAVTIALS